MADDLPILGERPEKQFPLPAERVVQALFPQTGRPYQVIQCRSGKAVHGEHPTSAADDIAFEELAGTRHVSKLTLLTVRSKTC